MGSFFATCSITGITITDNDTMYVQLLLPQKYTYVNKAHQQERGLQVSSDGALSNYIPFGFPILGIYADYGYISYYDENSSNIKRIEEFFNLSIDKVLEVATGRIRSKDFMDLEDDETVNNFEILEKLNMTYFKKEVYDHISDVSYFDDTSNNIFDDTILALNKSLHHKKDIVTDDIQYVLDKKDSGEELTEEEVSVLKEYTLDLIDEMKFDMSLNLSTYLGRYSSSDPLHLLKIDPSIFMDDLKRQYAFIRRLGFHYNKELMPSIYGSQDTNWESYILLNKIVEKSVLQNDFFEKEDDRELGDKRHSDIIKLSLSDSDLDDVNKRVDDLFSDKDYMVINKEQVRDILLDMKYNSSK